MAKGDEVFAYLHNLKNTPTDVLKGQNTPQLSASMQRYQQGDNTAVSDILKGLEPTINSAIRSYAQDNPEYKTKAKVLALEAIKTYDPSKSKLETHVFNHLKRLQRISADRGNFIHMPEQTALDKRQLDKLIRNYSIDNGVEPSYQWLSDQTGMPIKKISRLMNTQGQTSSSMTRSEQGDSLEAAPRNAIRLYEDTLYQELDEKDKKIYEWLTGYQGSPILDRATVASKLKISLPALSQRISKIDQFFASNGKRIEEVVYGRQAMG
jgi:DNA-directed RNA polymerase specialized sigma subunit